jgi:hypothetical protein
MIFTEAEAIQYDNKFRKIYMVQTLKHPYIRLGVGVVVTVW